MKLSPEAAGRLRESSFSALSIEPLNEACALSVCLSPDYLSVLSLLSR